MVKDVNNIDTGLWLPMDRRLYVNKIQYVDRLSAIGQAMIAYIVLAK